MDNGGSQQIKQSSSQVSVGESALPVTPVGTMQKEAGIINPRETKDVNEIIKSDEAELLLHPEVAEAGVEKVVEFPAVKKDQYEAGIRPAKESTPVITQPSGMVTLPMTDKEALRTIKTAKVEESRFWLASLVDKLCQKLGLAAGNKK